MGRSQRAPIEDWEQLQRLCTSPEQQRYEELRPLVLHQQTPASRSRETGTPAYTLRRRAARFADRGMASLFTSPPTLPTTTPHLPQALPAELKQLILDLKVEHPPLRVHEIGTICYAQTGRRPDAKTIKRILQAADPLPPRHPRRFAPYHHIPDPTRRRLAIVRLHLEGWTKRSIAWYLETSRETVHATLRRYVTEGIAGLTPRSRAPRRRTRKVTRSTIATVRRLQRNPGLEAFRMHAKLKQLGIDLSPRTCGRIMAMNRQLYADLRQDTPPHTPKSMPFAATRRHQYWTADIRYLDMHTLGDGQVYAMTILENYSRAILASAVSRSQDLTAYLFVLFAALQQHGCPEALVTDGGAVFKADQAKRIYAALSITHHRIPRRQSWQRYLETNFNVMRRMADWDFGRATAWRELVGVHDQWVGDFHYQVHWAHRHREDNRHSPVEVLGWVRGQVLDTPTLKRVFQTTRFVRHLDQGGYIQFRHWKLYAEQGLAGQAVDIWLHAEDLTITYAQQPLAQYTVTATETTTFDTVTDPQVLRKIVPPIWHRPPAFWSGSADAWLRVVPRTPPRRRRRRASGQTRFPW